MTGISFKRCCFLSGFYIVLGHPATYAEYFSLNKTTAELRVLQPINRDLYQRFTLIIKVIIVFEYLWVYCCIIQRQPFYLNQRLSESCPKCVHCFSSWQTLKHLQILAHFLHWNSSSSCSLDGCAAVYICGRFVLGSPAAATSDSFFIATVINHEQAFVVCRAICCAFHCYLVCPLIEQRFAFLFMGSYTLHMQVYILLNFL